MEEYVGLMIILKKFEPNLLAHLIIEESEISKYYWLPIIGMQK